MRSRPLPPRPPGLSQQSARHKHRVGSALPPRVFCAGIHFGDDFGQRHASLAELTAIQVNRRNAHHVALGDFVLERTAVNRRVLNAWVEDRHQVQRLHHVRAVVAGERVIGFKLKITVDIADLLQQRLRFFDG